MRFNIEVSLKNCIYAHVTDLLLLMDLHHNAPYLALHCLQHPVTCFDIFIQALVKLNNLSDKVIVIPGKVEEVWSWFKVFILVTNFLTFVCMQDRRILFFMSEIETI